MEKLAEKLNRLERWCDFYDSATTTEGRAWVTKLWPIQRKFRWFLRTRMALLLAAGAVVKLDRRDLLIDPDALQRQVVESLGLDVHEAML